ncbi:MAG: DUF1735 domain-containing protein [Muribaculaceae bacterium]|nr:DUF1735 domain-containing protein [Muribaculaceae bacterium]
MKINKYSAILAAVAAVGTFSACKNANVDFPDYEGGVNVYFAHQYPVRTLVMGDDTYDTSADNDHRCTIYATMGGAYKGRDITLQIAADPTLTDNLTFDGTTPVKAMPANYYELASSTISYDGNHMGGVDVKFTDAFFADPASTTNTYVIPLVITGQKGADGILAGTPNAEGSTPPRTKADEWSVLPKDYVLYCVKYKNKYDAEYATRGLDKVTEGTTTVINKRHETYVENDELRSVHTASLSRAVYPVSTIVTLPDGTRQTLTCELLLDFDSDDKCTISTDTPGCTATGTGKFVKDGEKNSWGNKDRNAIYLDYTVDFGTRRLETFDTLVVKSRNVAAEFFNPEYKN